MTYRYGRRKMLNVERLGKTRKDRPCIGYINIIKEKMKILCVTIKEVKK